MNKTELYNWLAEHDLGLTEGFYDLRFNGFSWVLTSLDGRIKYGSITFTCEKIVRELPNIASELYLEVSMFMDRRYPGWFQGRRTFTEMSESINRG